MKPFARIISMMVIFVLLISAQSIAFARGGMPVMDQAVLCIGSDTQIVYLDEDGRPTSAPHECPECLQVLLLTDLPHAKVTDFVSRYRALEPRFVEGGKWAKPRALKQPRGPPLT